MTNKTTGFGERLKRTRVKKGLTQAELGHMAGIQPYNICHLESGRREPSINSLISIVKALGVPADVLLGTSRP